MMLLFKISLAVFMAGSLLEMGLRLSLRDAPRGLRSLRFGGLGLAWSFILCPVLAWGISRVMPLEAPYALGLVLLGMAPCAPFVPMLVDRAKGDLGFTAAFMLLAAVGTVVCMPFTVPLLTKGLSASAWAIAKPLLIVILLPMAIGVVIRRQADAFATRLLPFAKKLAGIFGLLWIIVCLIIYGKALLGVVGSFAVASELLFFGVIFLGTYFLGFGLPYEQKIVLSIGVTTRNLGACLTPLLSVPDMDQRATLMIVLAVPLMVIVSLLGAKLLGPKAAATGTAG
jgi:bile acid:Na+ symporter, BASS family